MKQLLDGKRVLVTGGTRGIGREISLAFARAGAALVVCHRQDSPAVDSLVGLLETAGVKINGIDGVRVTVH